MYGIIGVIGVNLVPIAQGNGSKTRVDVHPTIPPLTRLSPLNRSTAVMVLCKTSPQIVVTNVD